ncbi:Hypothetical protein GLP15_1220 [Giardia lamblia P15]|uniref:Uncharacterized protein n=1 Tax=Giardia intestinalis (strain P15) TaxID=658858 RepID=E1EZU0_GIAIA|nr:Hypothetical protein GLP15_1220 [Giardia lamblia P15]
MIPNEHKAKVASITVIVDDSPVVMIFNDIHAALKLKRRLREVFPDTVFTKNIEDEMLEKQAKKIAGLVIQRRLFISPTLSDEDLRIEIQGKINSGTLLKKSVAPVAVGAPWPSSYESALSEKIKEAEKHVEKFANVSQPQATGVDIRSKMVYSTPAGSATFAKPEQQQQQQQPQVFARRSDSYVGQFLTPAGLATATGASQVQGDISVHAASIIPYSVHNGVTNPLTSANIFGPSAVNPGPNIIALGNVPLAQGSTNNMAASTSIASGQGPQIRVLTIPQLQASAVANQQGGYASALPNRILAHQPILGANYQGLATYATTGSQPAPYVAAIQQNAQQIAQLIPGSAVLTQLAAPGAMVGKVASQAPNVMPLSVQPAVHPAATPVSISSTGVIGHSKSQLGSADLSIPTSATITDQQADQTKVSDHLPSSMNTSYYSQPPMSDNSEIILTIDSDEYTDYPNAQEAFYINSHNILSINDIPTTEQVGNSSSPLLELITRWSRMIRQSRPASPMSVTQQEGEFYQYYKRLNVDHTHHLTVRPAAPKLWSPADQLSLFICAYDQVFAGVSDNIKQAWEGHKRAFLDSSITTTKAVAHAIESNAIDVHDLSSSSSHSSPSPSPVHSSFLPQSSSSLSSSSKTVENVMEAPTTQQLDDLSQGAAKPIIRLTSPLKEVRESESSAFPKHLFTTMPTNSNMSALQAGQELLNVGFPDKQKFFSDLLTQFPSAVNVSELTQINPNLSSLLSNSVSSLGVDQRQKQDLGVQEATAQMLTHLSFVNNKSTDIDSLLRNCQPPLTYLKTPSELPLKTLFTAPMSSCASSMPTIDCLFPPNKNIQIDVILLLYLLSFGGAVDEVKSDNDDLNFLPSETSSQILKEYTRKRCIEIQNKLLILYHKEDFFELKAGASSLYSRGNIRATIANYVTCAQNTNLNLHLSLQADNNPGKAVLSLPCVLLDSEHLALILPRTKEVSVGKDKEIDKLLESVAFMNGKLTRKEFYSRGKASQMIPSISSSTLGPHTDSDLKRHVRL